MRLKLTISTLIALIAVLPVAAQSASNKPTAQQFVGTYSYSFTFGGSKIALNADGTFQEDSGSCTFATQERGTYVYADGKLLFKILKYTGNQNYDGKEVDLFDPKLRREFFRVQSEVEDAPLKTQFVLYPVTWGGRVYLIYEHDLDDFTNAINFGLEPREFSPQTLYYGTFLLREGDEEKKTDGVPSLPPKYKERLLPEPITATIVNVETIGKEQIATIDKGRLAGVKVGTRFIRKDQEPESWSTNGVVLSVDDTSARVRTFDCVVGQVLTTKFERKDSFR